MKVIHQEDPFFSMTTMASNYEHLDLWELNYMFAIEKIDP